MIITEIRFRKSPRNRFLLEKFFTRPPQSAWAPTERKKAAKPSAWIKLGSIRIIRFQKENPFVSEAKSFVSKKKEEFVSGGPHAHVYSTETRNYPTLPVPCFLYVSYLWPTVRCGKCDVFFLFAIILCARVHIRALYSCLMRKLSRLSRLSHT